jgi:hypothetical protein
MDTATSVRQRAKAKAKESSRKKNKRGRVKRHQQQQQQQQAIVQHPPAAGVDSSATPPRGMEMRRAQANTPEPISSATVRVWVVLGSEWHQYQIDRTSTVSAMCRTVYRHLHTDKEGGGGSGEAGGDAAVAINGGSSAYYGQERNPR